MMVFYQKEKLEAGEELKMIHIRSEEEIKKISRSCQIVADTLIYLEDYLKIGEEVACYNNIEDAFSQIVFFLKNKEKRELIKNNSVTKARNEHTYLCRMKDIIENIYLYSEI